MNCLSQHFGIVCQSTSLLVAFRPLSLLFPAPGALIDIPGCVTFRCHSQRRFLGISFLRCHHLYSLYRCTLGADEHTTPRLTLPVFTGPKVLRDLDPSRLGFPTRSPDQFLKQGEGRDLRLRNNLSKVSFFL